MTKHSKLVFTISFLVIVIFFILLSNYLRIAKQKKAFLLFELGQSVSRSLNKEPENAAIEIRFNNDDTKIITLLNSGKIELWDLKEKTKKLISQTDHVYSYCPNNDLIVTKKNNGIYLTDINSNNNEVLTNGEYKLSSIDKSCKTLALSKGNNIVEIWNLETRKLISIFKTSLPVRNGIAISSDGLKLAAAEGIYHEKINKHETIIELWDIKKNNSEPVLRYDEKEKGLIMGVWNILFTDDNNKIIFDTQSAAESGIMLIDKQGNTLFEKSGFKSYWMRSTAFNNIRNYLATGDENNNLVVWDLNSKGIAFYTKVGGVVESLAISNDGKLLAAGLADSRIQVFNINKNN